VIIMGSIWNRNEQNFGGEIADKICPYHSFWLNKNFVKHINPIWRGAKN
jgi:hypothetical protein